MEPLAYTLREAMAITGLRLWTLRRMAYAGKVRRMRNSTRMMLHGEDVRALAADMWIGKPYQKKDEVK